MRILYISQYFIPEMGAPAARVHEISREWVRAGHDVTVLTTFSNHPTGYKSPEDCWVLKRREKVDGIDLRRVYSYATPNKGVGKRMLGYLSFLAGALMLGLPQFVEKKPHVVVGTSPQLLAGVAGFLIARALGRPFVFEVRDLWPESILAVKAMEENLVVRGLKGLADLLYRQSDRIVTVGEGYKRKIVELYGIPESKIDVIPNGVVADQFTPGAGRDEICAEHGWEDRFVVLYMGTHGMAHALSKVLDAAKRLESDREILFAFVGEGAEKEALKTRAREQGLSNVIFIDQQPKSMVSKYYAACDLGLVTLRKDPLFQEVLPSKIFEYMAMEKPLLISVGGQARELVETACAGRFVEPENPEALAAATLDMKTGSEERARMGKNGRTFVLANYDRCVLARRYMQVLESVVKGRSVSSN